MTTATAETGAGRVARARYGSMSRDRRWAMRWSYFFLVLFAIFFLTPPLYMFITSLKTSAEISAATNPWWVYHPTLSNYIELLTSNMYLTFFRNSAIVSVCVVAITTLFSLIVTFANFDIVRILTSGGPLDKTHLFATWAFKVGIEGSDIPLGASVSLFMVPILAIAAVFILRDVSKRGNEA